MRRCVGLDFGTTNSSLAVSDGSGAVATARFLSGSGSTEAFRSVLYFERPAEGLRHRQTSVFSGPAAIERYLEADPKGRLIQSIKSFATSRGFRATNVFGRNVRFEELIALIVKGLVAAAEKQFGPLGDSVTVGRPVRFAGARTPEDEQFALDRIQAALELCGFGDVRFEYEPVGAAYFYESRLDHDELVLIGDFGGGTSDFSLLRVGPAARRLPAAKRFLGHEGVGLAGDAFDARIIRNLVSPLLGEGSSYQSLQKTLPMPSWVYAKLERWHHLSFLKSGDTMRMLSSIRANALEPEKIEALIHLIENDLGYLLHRSVQDTKVRLSAEHCSPFQFVDGDLQIAEDVTRSAFEYWIGAHLQAIRECVDRLLAASGVQPKDVDRVFLTGGSSFVPAVRGIFVSRFGREKMSGGEEFTSVARGLALRAQDPDAIEDAPKPEFRESPEDGIEDQ